MLVLFFKKKLWKVQRCENAKCRRIAFLSKKDIECKKRGLHKYSYGYYCKKCGQYNIILDNQIPKKIKTDIRYEKEVARVFNVIERRKIS